jgi:surface protein
MPTLIAQAKLRQATRLTVVDKKISAVLTSAITITCIGAKVKRTIIDLDSVSTISLTPEKLLRIGFTNIAQTGYFQRGQRYQITDLGTADFNLIADTTGVTYQVGSVFTAANTGEKTPPVTGRAMLLTNLTVSTLTCKFPTYIRIDLEALGMDSYEGQDCIMQLDEGVVIQGNYPGSEFTPNPPEASFMTFRIPKYFRSQLASSITSSNLVLRIKQLASSLNSAVSVSAFAQLNPGKFAALVFSLGSINAVARKTAVGASALSSILSTVINNTRARLFDSSLSSQFTLPPIDFWYRRLGVSAMSSTATIAAAVTRNIGPITAFLDAAGFEQGFQFTSTAKRTAALAGDLLASSSVNASGIATLGIPAFTITTISSVSVTAEVPMILKYTITNGSGTIYLPIFYGNINCKVDWGDGSAIQTVTQRELSSGGFNLGISHNYNSNGTYTVKIFGTLEKVGKPRYTLLPNTTNLYPFNNHLTEIQSFGDLGTTSFEQAFSNASKLQKVARRIPSTVTDISWMFWFSSAGDQESGWNVDDCQYWNTVNITTMSGTFMRCREGFNAPIGNWNTSNVTDMSYMFHFASNDTNGFNQNLNSWNTGNVTNMSYMFRQCKFYNQPMNNWDVSKVSNFIGMFWGESPINAFNQDIGAWDVTGCTQRSNMAYMLYTGGSLSNLDLSQWCVPTIATEPDNFVGSGTLAFNKKPVWGTCP